MSTPVKPQTIGQLIQAQIPAIAMVVGGSSKAERDRRAERFARICLTAVRNTPKLQNATMESFAAAMMICAQLDLEPNTPQGLAFLIPYENRKRNITECQFQIGYKGLLQLAYRSGVVTAFNADVVYKAEVEAGMFRYRKGISPSIEHDVDLLRPELRDGEIVAAYAACILRGGQPLLRVVDAREVQRAQKTSASMAAAKKYNKLDSSPWQTSPEAMWMKTAIKRLAAWMPQTETLAIAVEADDKAERGESLSPEKSATDKLNDVLAGAATENLGAETPPQRESAQETPALEEFEPGETIDLSGVRAHADPVAASASTAMQSTLFTGAPDPSRAVICPKTGAPVDELDCAGKSCRAQCPEFE